MSYLDIDIQRSYRSCGDSNIANAFITPALKCTKVYRRSVGYFSSNVFLTILDGVVALARNNGSVQLIASPKLSSEDIEAINHGYAERDKIIRDSFQRDFLKEIESLDDMRLALLSELISRGILDIRIAVTDTIGDYHDKLGIMQDFDGNSLVFYGSANATMNGYKNNYEKIRVVRSWIPGEVESVEDEIEEFESLWNGTNEYVQVYDFKESAKKNVLQVIQQRHSAASAQDTPIKLRDYQEKAIQAWVENDYRGFYVMATGTGKTWTAIFSAKKLLEGNAAMIVICAPYKHLVKQWADDVIKAFPDAKVILVSSENPSWEQQIKQEIIRKSYNPSNQIIGNLSGCLLRHPVAVRVKGDAPIQKETQFGAHGMGSRFHHYKLTLGDGFQFIWCHESTLHHLQGLAALFPLTDGAGQYRPAAEGSGEGICRFALGRKAAEDGVLAVVTYNFRTFFTIVLL